MLLCTMRLINNRLQIHELSCLCCLSVEVCVHSMQKSVCAADEYYDGLMDQCVPCSEICHSPLDFCRNNCKGSTSNKSVWFIVIHCDFSRVLRCNVRLLRSLFRPSVFVSLSETRASCGQTADYFPGIYTTLWPWSWVSCKKDSEYKIANIDARFFYVR